jgi:hypothetical protein
MSTGCREQRVFCRQAQIALGFHLQKIDPDLGRNRLDPSFHQALSLVIVRDPCLQQGLGRPLGSHHFCQALDGWFSVSSQHKVGPCQAALCDEPQNVLHFLLLRGFVLKLASKTHFKPRHPSRKNRGSFLTFKGEKVVVKL